MKKLLTFTFLLLLAGCQTLTNASPSIQEKKPVWVSVFDGGVELKTGNQWYLPTLQEGTYKFELTASDGVRIITFPSDKDYKLYAARAEYEYYSSCSAENSIRFNKECNLKEGSMFVVENDNFLDSTNAVLKVTKLTYE